jgi:hypothetical protein
MSCRLFSHFLFSDKTFVEISVSIMHVIFLSVSYSLNHPYDICYCALQYAVLYTFLTSSLLGTNITLSALVVSAFIIRTLYSARKNKF